MYLFLAVLGLWSCTDFSCGKWGLLSSCGAWASRRGDFSCCRARALRRSGFSSCGPLGPRAQAQ